MVVNVPAGLGIEASDQLLPFQFTANGSRSPVVGTYPPTAVHLVAEMHKTALKNSYPGSPAGTGMVSFDHVLPFQRLATTAPPSIQPTAVQAVEAVQETLPSEPPPVGVGASDHFSPSQLSASSTVDSSYL
jgi:hypothetical protein